ncbi:mannose-6-phosphate isomerase, class I [Tessaracoccus sp. OH4464_COT-324]|uniref:mannose-6-phosphate isomerase, class I n=1 Tax=Tessaracoccus sp. OH4464_COT-324 TaxID=2491059 RepID=UPI000F630FE1|nr:mannose-6-phosphate isomerase, class I [Tessaracoccus sp. OH4464_COT-324]RRD46731.1 mannose-6-phosphate isomerase, class I [Tessaracoccus sp. OH4464_COT-324]
MRVINGTVQHFAWGDRSELPRVLGRTPDGRPWAEYWLGAHHAGPATFADSPEETLADYLQHHPEEIGAESVAAHGEKLPFMMKLLSAASPLSIQVHPSREQAVEGFAKESLLGIPLNHPERSYRDDWPKPEAIIALTPFEGLLGFRDPAETVELFEQLGVAQELTSVIGPLRERTETLALQEVFLDVLTIRKRRHLVDLVLSRAVEFLDAGGALGDFARTAVEVDEHFPGDPGILAALLLNRFRLEPGEAVALEAGVLHAYLRGTGVEVMASSDNIVRGGLTKKHIDVDGLLGLANFSALKPETLRPEGADGVYRYPTDFPEFEVWLLTPMTAAPVTMPRGDTGRVALVTDGDFTFRSNHELKLKQGEAVFIPAWEEVEVIGAGQVFVAASGV